MIEKRKNKPELAFGLRFYYEAFFNIGSDRMPSQTVWNISWYSTQKYAEYYEMDFEQSDKLHFIISKMDDAYIEFMSDKDGKKQQSDDFREAIKGKPKGNKGKK